MDALELLTADHNRVRALFKRFEDAEATGDAARMQLLAGKIVEELRIHMAIEDEIFYPAAWGESEEIKAAVYEGVEEHHVAKVLIEELAAMAPEGDRWTAKVKVLIESVEHHIDEEESDMFPAVRSKTSAERRERLGTRLAERKISLGAPLMQVVLDLTMEELKEKATGQLTPDQLVDAAGREDRR